MQAEVAKRIGVCEDSIHHWEVGDTAPALQWIPGIIRFLDYDPRPVPSHIGARLRHWREGQGVSQFTLARTLGVDPGTLARWEKRERYPTGQRLGRVRRLLGGTC
jgi:DNA-binding transcriptional regulator YiaG